LIGKNIEDITNFRFFSAFFLFIATLFFIQLLFEKKFPLLQKINLPFKSNFLKNISFLFQNPKGLKGYLLGLILGLIPCGLLYGAFAICVAIKTPSLAAAGMFLFGLATFPALFLTAWSGFIVRITEFKILTKIVILINIITLFSLALKQI
jgi:hypothetical protein